MAILNKHPKNSGITLIELLVFVFFIIVGFFSSSYFGKKFGCIGFILGFPTGIIIVIATLSIVAFVSETIGYINFNRKKKLEQFSKNLKNGFWRVFSLQGLAFSPLRESVRIDYGDLPEIGKPILSNVLSAQPDHRSFSLF